jgi:GST-like protein
MIRFYYHPAPNPLKVALFLEETGLEYQLVPVDKLKGEQFRPEFLAINPNGKVPAITDGDIAVFDSAAVLLYLSEKTGKFGASAPAERAALLSWLMFIATGLSPFSGQAVHFLFLANQEVPYAKQRYLKEAERHYRVLDDRLAKSRYIAGDTYSIVDMAAWGWLCFASYIFGERGFADYPHVSQLFAEVSARPAAKRALALKDRHAFQETHTPESRSILYWQTQGKQAAPTP